MRNRINVAYSSSDLLEFLRETKLKSGFELLEIEIGSQKEWLIQNGALSHTSGGFFHVVGFVDEQKKQERIVLYQPQGAFNGLVLCRQKEKIYLLIQARVEPGNVGVVQYGPTVQSTPANYLRVHGGRSTPYLDYFLGYGKRFKPLGHSSQLDIGERYFQKTKTLSYIEVPELIDTDENMIWVPLEILHQFMEEDNVVNTDLRSIVGVFDWDGYLGINSTLKDSFDFNYVQKAEIHIEGRLVSLEELQKWKISSVGIIGRDKDALEARLFRTRCTTREVTEWCQPLICTSNTGLIVLYIRKINEEFEVLLTLGHEFGISGGKVWLPSILHYSEKDKDKDNHHNTGKIMSDVWQSEEGGRFYQNLNRYQVVFIEDELTHEPNQFWLSMSQLKYLLSTSNQASIQLRCAASLILHYMNRRLRKQDRIVLN